MQIRYDSEDMVILNEKKTKIPTRDGKYLNVMVEGEGDKALIFLHGLGENHNFFTHQVHEFRSGHKVISIDQRGHGFSYKLKPPERLSLQTWADDVYDVVKYASVERAVLMGHSFGSTVSLKFAIDHPEVAKGVITTGGLSEIEPEPRKQMETWVRDYERAGDEAALKLLKGYDPEWDLNAEFARAPENRILTDRMRRVNAEDDPYNFIEGTRAINYFALTPDLPKVKCPVLILAGDVDMFVPVSHSIKLSKNIPISFLKVMHVAHNPHIEEPEISNALISRFLKMLEW